MDEILPDVVWSAIVLQPGDYLGIVVKDDRSLPDGVKPILQKLKEKWPGVEVLVFVGDVELKAFRPAEKVEGFRTILRPSDYDPPTHIARS